MQTQVCIVWWGVYVYLNFVRVRQRAHVHTYLYTVSYRSGRSLRACVWFCGQCISKGTRLCVAMSVWVLAYVYGRPLVSLWILVCRVYFVRCAECALPVFTSFFQNHIFWIQLFFADCLIQSGKKCWEPHFGPDSLRHFGDFVLNSILGVSQSLPGIHARSEAYAQWKSQPKSQKCNSLHLRVNKATVNQT